MAYYKCTFVFTSQKYRVGWTENWYKTGTGASEIMDTLAGYVSNRAGCLSDAASITAVRVCNVDPPRDSLYMSTMLPVKGSFLEASNPIAGVWDALLVRRDGINNNVLGHMFMHFVPASIFSGRDYIGDPTSGGWNASFTSLQTHIISNVYYLRQYTFGSYTYVPCQVFTALRRTERRLGRPFDALHGKRLVA